MKRIFVLFAIVFSEDCSLGIEEVIAAYINIYPNPVKDMLSLQTQGGLEIDSVALYDTLGRKILERTEVPESIDIAALSPGIYFMHITTARGIVTQKIIKE